MGLSLTVSDTNGDFGRKSPFFPLPCTPTTYETVWDNVTMLQRSRIELLRSVYRVYCLHDNWSNSSWQKGRHKVVLFQFTQKMAWSSFPWILVNTPCCPSTGTTPHRQRTSMYSARCGSSDRSGWSDDSRSSRRHDSSRTTIHLCTALQTTNRTTRRCPGLECWTAVLDEASGNHLYTANTTPTHITKLYRREHPYVFRFRL